MTEQYYYIDIDYYNKVSDKVGGMTIIFQDDEIAPGFRFDDIEFNIKVNKVELTNEDSQY